MFVVVVCCCCLLSLGCLLYIYFRGSQICTFLSLLQKHGHLTDTFVCLFYSFQGGIIQGATVKRAHLSLVFQFVCNQLASQKPGIPEQAARCVWALCHENPTNQKLFMIDFINRQFPHDYLLARLGGHRNTLQQRVMAAIALHALIDGNSRAKDILIRRFQIIHHVLSSTREEELVVAVLYVVNALVMKSIPNATRAIQSGIVGLLRDKITSKSVAIQAVVCKTLQSLVQSCADAEHLTLVLQSV